MVKTSDLKKQLLFEDLSSEHLNTIARSIKKLTFKKDEFLFTEKDETKGLYLIHSGKVGISKRTPDGWQQTLAVFSPCSFLGELSIIENRRHEATATALKNTTVFLITKKDFINLEKMDTVIALHVMKKLFLVLTKNLRRMNEKFLNSLISY